MKNFRLVFSFLLLVLSVEALFAQKTVKYDLGAFSEITLRNDARLILKQGPEQLVTVKAREETISKMIVEVKDRTLVIRYAPKTWFESGWAPGEVTFVITAPQIDQLTVSGSGSIIAEDQISSRILSCYVSGSGFIRLKNVVSEKVTAGVSGSGHMQLAGEELVKEVKLMVSGSGGMKASGLRARTANVLISGSGNCEVNVVDMLSCKIAGSGNVTYVGNPQIESTIVGPGTVSEAR